jgi:hypothetical protein
MTALKNDCKNGNFYKCPNNKILPVATCELTCFSFLVRKYFVFIFLQTQWFLLILGGNLEMWLPICRYLHIQGGMEICIWLYVYDTWLSSSQKIKHMHVCVYHFACIQRLCDRIQGGGKKIVGANNSGTASRTISTCAREKAKLQGLLLIELSYK